MKKIGSSNQTDPKKINKRGFIEVLPSLLAIRRVN